MNKIKPNARTTDRISATQSQNIEIDLLFEAVFLKYGYDFRNYSHAHLKRRVLNLLEEEKGLGSVSDIQHKVLYDTDFFTDFLLNLSINVTEMFRDPAFFKSVRKNVIPILNTYPYLKIWAAGCASGEEVYSLAIVLDEEHVGQKSQIYATDFNQRILEVAKEGIYPIENMRQYSENYQRSGSCCSLSDYFHADEESVILNKSLRKNVVFADHNLATDGIFGEMHMIICRNVLIYFNKTLQEKVFTLFYESLIPGGFLCLGTRETLRFSECDDYFELIDEKNCIYRKRY